MHAAVIVNPRARRLRRTPELLSRIAELLREAGIEAHVFLTPALSNYLAVNPEALIAVGGDGTIGFVAELCLKHELPLGVIPAGTHNHFARDLGLMKGVEQAVDVIAKGLVRRIDVGEVNGRPFINNSSIGAYPRALEERDDLIERFGLKKSIAQVIATIRVFARRPIVRAEMEIDGRHQDVRTPFVFVGNNIYNVDPLQDRLRSAVDQNILSIYTSEAIGLGGFFRLLWLAVLGRFTRASDVRAEAGREVLIRLPKRSVRVSKDGEVLRLETPLHYAVRPRALRVFAPE